jgi:hypothetical protein
MFTIHRSLTITGGVAIGRGATDSRVMQLTKRRCQTDPGNRTFEAGNLQEQLLIGGNALILASVRTACNALVDLTYGRAGTADGISASEPCSYP